MKQTPGLDIELIDERVMMVMEGEKEGRMRGEIRKQNEGEEREKVRCMTSSPFPFFLQEGEKERKRKREKEYHINYALILLIRLS